MSDLFNNTINLFLYEQLDILSNFRITEVDNFEDTNDNDISICFTTIQQLHYDMKNNKEETLTPKDVADKIIVSQNWKRKTGIDSFYW